MSRPWVRLARRDLADLVIHWTRGVRGGGFFSSRRAMPTIDVLDRILGESRLIGGDGYIRGGYTCVCFTEAPLPEMISLFASANRMGESLRYEPFGIGVSKEWLFEKGGRPVIYQSDGEYEVLPIGIRWRHN